ncbi:hypothetical protein RclHR1_06820007 [Rhizophagus clarus]|nr:hypothetical protein RclHR1_06820007 [Rhizophagus clarus]
MEVLKKILKKIFKKKKKEKKIETSDTIIPTCISDHEKEANHQNINKPRNLWKNVNYRKYQMHAIISPIDPITKSKEIHDRVVYMKDLEKRKEVYGICGECNEPGTGLDWCQPCNAKRFRENFKNWTSGNKDIDELIQYSQLNSLHYTKCLEWIPFEHFKKVTYITSGGFGKIYSAEWPEGFLGCWNIEKQKWYRYTDCKVALKSLDNSSIINTDFLNEIKSHLQIYLWNIIYCYGITQDPSTKDYMMVFQYCQNGNLRNFYLNKPEEDILKLNYLLRIANGLLNIHNAGKIHKDFHIGNILVGDTILISDLGMCQSENKNDDEKSEEIYGVLPYMAPEVLRGNQYTKAADIYSFGIMMNEYFSDEIPFNDTPHDYILATEICKGLRPKISEGTPQFLEELIIKCWDNNAENRPTAEVVFLTLKKWDEMRHKDGEIRSQIEKYEEIRINRLKTRLNSSNSASITTHPQAIYTSRLLNFKDLPEPVNSSASTNPISECFDVQLSELDLNEINQENNDTE